MHVSRGWYLKERDPTSQWTAGPGGEYYHTFERHLDHGDQEQQPDRSLLLPTAMLQGKDALGL